MSARQIIPIVAVCAALLGAALFIRVTSKPHNRSSTFIASEKTRGVKTIVSPPIPASMTIQPITQKVTVTLTTSMGEIRLELEGTRAPLAVGNVVALAKKGFYNGTTFHRVIPDFMIQGGDPLSKDPAQRALHGTGGPGYTFPDEINGERIVRGTVAMANAGPNTNGSQFFIVTASATPHLDKKHTNFGKVIAGMDVVDKISQVARDENDNPRHPVVINTVTVETALAAPFSPSPSPERE